MDTALGLVGLIIFCAAVISFAAAVTWLVVKLFPTRTKKKPEPQAS